MHPINNFKLFLSALFFITIGAVRPASAQDVSLYRETFNEVATPNMPAAWRVSGESWETNDGVSSEESGGNNLRVKGTEPDTATLPVLDLSKVKSARLRFLARRTSTYPQDSLRVTAAAGAQKHIVLLPAGEALPASESGDYTEIMVKLPASLLGESDVVIRFEALGGESGGSNARIDDIVLHGAITGLRMTPARIEFSVKAGARQTKTLTVENHEDHAVRAAAPRTEGVAFSTSASSMTLAAGAEKTFSVTYAPQERGPHTGAVHLQYGEEQEAVATLAGSTDARRFGFSRRTSTAFGDTTGIAIPLALTFRSADRLQSLQFRVTWDEEVPAHVTGVRFGKAVDDTSAWRLSYEAVAPGAMSVILMKKGQEGLPAGSFDPMLTLSVAGEAVDEKRTVDVHLTDIVGALAVPAAADAGVSADTTTHTLTLEPRTAELALSASSLDAGAVAPGAVQKMEVTASHAAGYRAITISNVASSNPLFAVTPTSAVIKPGERQVFTIAFTPDDTHDGKQTGVLSFVHDGTNETPVALTVTGRSTFGRGDPSGDGIVDVMDLMQGVDFVLKREDPDGQQQEAIDLFPFAEGDGALDVRDLTVLAQAITRQQWPDGASLPRVGTPSSSVQRPRVTVHAREAGATASSPNVKASLVSGAKTVTLKLEHECPLRAVELVLDVEGDLAALPSTILGRRASQVTTRAKVDTVSHTVHLLMYRLDGETIAPGAYAFAHIKLQSTATQLIPRYATAVDAEGDRAAVEVDTEAARAKAGKDSARLHVDRPFPQPLQVGRASLRIPVNMSEPGKVRVVVYDLLGRRVAALPKKQYAAGRTLITWDGRSRSGRSLSAGAYVLGVQAGSHRATKTIIVQ